MPASPRPEVDLRPATLDDVGIVADLEATRDPQDPRDPEMLRFWWTRDSAHDVHVRLVAEREGTAVAFVGAGHEQWDTMPTRFGWIHVIVHRDLWSESGYTNFVNKAETWLRAEGAAIAVARVRGDHDDELEALGRAGYNEVRQQRIWELDLVAGRDRLLAAAERCRGSMRGEGVTLLTVADDRDPDCMTKLYAMAIETEKDVPTTVPWRTIPFDEWKRFWFESPGIRADRFWIAREGDAIVGLSVINYPPNRGLPWTFFTGISRAVRARGIARALKYETIAQAIDLGCEQVRTGNDRANAPILHLNEEMGYQLVAPVIELHRELEPPAARRAGLMP